jgi:hypothetical protein
MSTSYESLEDTLRGLDTAPVARRQLLSIVRLLKQYLGDLDERLTTAEQYLGRIDERLSAVEAACLRLVVVDELPASGPAQTWYRLPDDPLIYVGNGADQPLTRLETEALA